MSAMSKQHYVATAGIISNARRYATDTGSSDAVATANLIAFELAEFFAADNPRFDRKRFLAAAGIKGGGS